MELFYARWISLAYIHIYHTTKGYKRYKRLLDYPIGMEKDGLKQDIADFTELGMKMTILNSTASTMCRSWQRR